MATGPDAGPSGPVARVILQQCLSARLQVQPAKDCTPAEFVQIKRGLIIHICFLKGATSNVIEKIVKSTLSAKLSSSSSGKLVSILDLPGDLLIVPQATLGGRLKGKMFQYHNNIDKAAGLELYTDFVTQCKAVFQNNSASVEANCVVKNGTYGNIQVLSMDTNGPYTHMLEF